MVRTYSADDGLPPPHPEVQLAARDAIQGKTRGLRAILPFLGPAFIASIAYTDPGNFATNISAGGDSGSLVLSSAPGSQPGTQDDFVLGLLFAGSPQATIVNHFEHVRALLRIEVYP